MSGLDYDRAKRFIAAVPQGQWTAFKDVAEAAGSPGAAMSIGVWLGAEGGTVVNPWRVVRADGSVPPDYHSDAPGCPHNATEARVKLEREGVRFTESHKARPEQHFRVKDWHALPPAREPVATGIQPGATVRVINCSSGGERTWTLVPLGATDPAAGRVSVESPVGRALIGRSIGDTVTVSAPAGDRRYRIIDAHPYPIPTLVPVEVGLQSHGAGAQPFADGPSMAPPVDLDSELLERAASESPPWLPVRVSHADWGTAASKCVVATAELKEGIYHAHPPRPVLEKGGLVERMRLGPGAGQSTLLGFDFPLGVPRAYARNAGIRNFAHWFRELDLRSPFFEVASEVDEVSTDRPFFPKLIVTKSPGIKAQFHLALGLTAAQMLRRCDRSHCGNGGASPMFWALGPKAVAKMTLAGWSTAIRPALIEPGRRYTIWPFDGTMPRLLETSDAVIVETYPRDAYLQLGLRMGAPGTAKTRQADRAAEAPGLLKWCAASAVRPDEALLDQIMDGFGAGKDGEDLFDAIVGLFGMIATMRRAAEPELPDDPAVRLVEGWMFGQHPVCPTPPAGTHGAPNQLRPNRVGVVKSDRPTMSRGHVTTGAVNPMSWKAWQPGEGATEQERSEALRGIVLSEDGVHRCWWAEVAPEYRTYHDLEWGLPVGDDVRLFEALSLEAFQTGLAWLVILRKREAFRRAFAGFDPERVAGFGELDVRRLLGDKGIVRHRAKIEATINNARRALHLARNNRSLAHYFWQFEPAAGEALDRAQFERRTETPESRALAGDLKARGWRFVGPSTVQFFMQAVGLVNDHVAGCELRDSVTKAREGFVRP